MSERCSWCGSDPVYVAYHDTEWGVPERDPRALWEKLVLDGFQAGLSWITILRKRDAFRAAFEGFDPERVARWGEAEVARCLADAGIVRHRGKIEATIGNAKSYLKIADSGGFDTFLWRYVDGRAVQNRFRSKAEVPTSTDLSARMSQDMTRAGFRFVGPTIVYAFMEAVGIVNDHIVTCPCHNRVAALA
jgi:DNA-3-methyladenine glycosylase I